MANYRNILEAEFFVQRGSEIFKVKGKDIEDKVKDGDVFFVQRGDEQFKFTSKRIEFVWEEEAPMGWYHIKNVTGGELKLWPQNSNTTKIWDQFQNPVPTIEPGAGREYFVSGVNSNRELNSFQGNAGINWDFGDRGDVHLLRNGTALFKGCSNFNGNVDCFRDIPWRFMKEMFMGCTRFNQDISEWFGCGNLWNNHDYDRMFFGCAGFTQDLSGWCGSTDWPGVAAPADVYTGSGIENQPAKQINMSCRIKTEIFPQRKANGAPLSFDEIRALYPDLDPTIPY